MGKFLKILFCFVVVDFYFFSTKFSFSHGYNTKELLAVMGIFLFLTDLYQRRKFAVTREFIGLLIYSGLISLMAVFSATVHNTKETLYTTYFLSMLVWLSASYTAIRCIKAVHGKLSVELVAAYVVGVSVAQGLIAVIADNYAPLSDIIVRPDYQRKGYGKMVVTRILELAKETSVIIYDYFYGFRGNKNIEL